ncbi:hypothetical protein PL404_09710, partial [Bifidobacterium adolescentis]|nr:hypothetical protein [Bifidobacterium adolescentis]
LRTHCAEPLLSYTPFYISYGKMQAIHGVTVVYARNSFIAFIAALLAILRVSERPDATGSKSRHALFPPSIANQARYFERLEY